jgi:DNA replication protein DnaC
MKTEKAKTMAQIIPKTLETLASLPTSKSKSDSSPPNSPATPPRVKPCETAWQRKWLDLECHHSAIQQLAGEAQEWAFRWFRNVPVKSLLVIHGETGCGKTHVARRLYEYARAAASMAWQKGHHQSPPSVVAMKWPECVASMIDHGEDAWVLDACEAGFLWLDDIGAENDPWKKGADRLCQILSRRETKFSVVTTNIASAQWPERFDIRIADRLFRNAAVVDLSSVPSFTMI